MKCLQVVSRACKQNPFWYFVLACTCDLDGSIDNHCGIEDGKCTCKNNVAGHNCHKCDQDYYVFPECKPGKSILI